MPCYHLIPAWQLQDGEVVFAERGNVLRALQIPCGRCYGCRLERSRRWAMRCVHESQMHDMSSFVTLTYDEESCPVSLRYSDFQKFMKRLRRKFGQARFFMCGEYGERTLRPHYHACLFGVFFADRVLHGKNGEYCLYRSDCLSKLWPHGFASIGDVTFNSAAYVARYVMKKINGAAAEDHYRRVVPETGEIVDVVPEFCHMSLKPGIGATWFEKYHSDVFGRLKDRVIVNGRPCKPPKYYFQRLAELDPDLYEDIEYRRYLTAGIGREDRTEERMAVREKVAVARGKLYNRSGV